MRSCNSRWVETLTHHFKKTFLARTFRLCRRVQVHGVRFIRVCHCTVGVGSHRQRLDKNVSRPHTRRNKLFGTPEINLVPSFSFFAVGCKHSANLAIFQNNWHNYLHWDVHLKSIMRAVRSLPLGAANPPNRPCDCCLVIIYVPEASWKQNNMPTRLPPSAIHQSYL